MALVLTAVLGAAMFVGCGNSSQNQASGTSESSPSVASQSASASQAAGSGDTKEKTKINVAVLKGPTGIGAAKLIDENTHAECKNSYNFDIASAPDEITGKIISGDVDIAAVPTNVAAVLYNKTKGDVQIAAINTLGNLYVLDNGNENIKSIKDLKGKTITLAGQGSIPEFALRYILNANGVQADLDFMSDHAAVAQALASGEASIAVLPEPQVTAVELKDSKVVTAIDLSKEWENACKKNGVEDSKLAMGCIVARKDFIEKNEEAFKNFLTEYEDSIDYTENASDVAKLVEKYQIMDSAAAAEKAIPNCNIVYFDGKDMKTMVANLYKVLYDANPTSIGGKIPDDNFYYNANE